MDVHTNVLGLNFNKFSVYCTRDLHNGSIKNTTRPFEFYSYCSFYILKWQISTSTDDCFSEFDKQTSSISCTSGLYTRILNCDFTSTGKSFTVFYVSSS